MSDLHPDLAEALKTEHPVVFNSITISEELRKAYLKAKSRGLSSGLSHCVFSHREEFIIEDEDGEVHIYFDVCARVKRIKP